MNAMPVRRLKIRIKGNPKQEPGGISSEDKVQTEWGSK